MITHMAKGEPINTVLGMGDCIRLQSSLCSVFYSIHQGTLSTSHPSNMAITYLSASSFLPIRPTPLLTSPNNCPPPLALPSCWGDIPLPACHTL